MALYRKYRPATFAEVVGQEHVTVPLSNALASRGPDGKPDRINHAYLFSGPRGCGKTSSARILARSLNCAEGPTPTPCGRCDSCLALAPGGVGHLDVVELDAASHNGVEDMRELRDKAMYPPTSSRYTIFIIDEAHMVTNQGFNALLKVVEEPPEHLIFIFATTEPEKVIPTIRSRTHHYPFRLLGPKDMRGLLERIVEQEGVVVDPQVYPLVISAGGGSPRDSLSILDQLVAGAGPEGVTYQLATSLLGVTDESLLDEAVEALAGFDRAALFTCVDRVVDSGLNPRRFAEDLLARVRDLMILASVPNAVDMGLVEVPGDRAGTLAEQAQAIPPGALTRYAEVLHRGIDEMRGATSQRLLLEVLCARLLLPGIDGNVESLVQRVEALERGRPAPAPSPEHVRDDAPAAAPAASPGPDAGPGGAADSGVGVDGDGSGPSAEPGSGRRALEEYRRRRAAKTGERQPERNQPPAQPQPPAPEPQQQAPAPEPQGQAPAPEPQGQAPAHDPQTPPPPASAAPSRAAGVDDLLAAREAARRMQELARQQEKAERERIAMEQERAARRAEGLREDPAESGTPGDAAERPPLDIATLRATWGDVMEAVPQERLAARVMAAQATPLSLEDGELVVGHHTGALANRLNAEENLTAIRTAVRQVHGLDVVVRFVVGTRSGSRQRQSSAAPAEGVDAADSPSDPGPRSAPGEQSAPGRRQPAEPAPAADSATPSDDSAADAEPARPIPRWKKLAQQRRRVDAQEQARKEAEEKARQDAEERRRARAAVHRPVRPEPSDDGSPGFDAPPPPEPYDDVPPPPEPWDDAPPPPDEPPETGAAPAGAAAAEDPGPRTQADEEREYIDAAQSQPGSLDHRSQREVVIEMLQKELGARLV